jgi:2-hydroxycyclohexanecarboxyl-CoA dehydrogenase
VSDRRARPAKEPPGAARDGSARDEGDPRSSDLLDLRERVALITGGGRGIGAEIARYFAAHNCGTLLINDFHLDRAEAVADEVERMGCRALPLQCDVAKYDEVLAAVARAERETGRIDILVNNAGNAGPSASISDRRMFWQTGPEDWMPWLETSLFGVLNCSRAVVGGMIEREYGRVVTVISDAGRVGDGSLAVYSAAKAGAAGFTRSLARATGRYGITANCVSLAAIDTTATAGITADREVVRKLLRAYTIRRLGEPSDAAAAVLFLASDAAGWITGQTYPVNGGFSFAM